jgi:hypothetical protein
MTYYSLGLPLILWVFWTLAAIPFHHFSLLNFSSSHGLSLPFHLLLPARFCHIWTIGFTIVPKESKTLKILYFPLWAVWLHHKIKNEKQGVCHILALPFTLKLLLRQKKNYGNTTFSPCRNIILKKSSKRNQNASRNFNSIINLKFQHKPKYHFKKILI